MNNTGITLNDCNEAQYDVPKVEADLPRRSPKETERIAKQLLESLGVGFVALSQTQKMIVSEALNHVGLSIEPGAFDLVKVAPEAWVNFDQVASVQAGLAFITIYELKSSDRTNLGAGFSRYYFSLEDKEEIAALALGSKYRFVFFAIRTGAYLDCDLSGVLARAKGTQSRRRSIQF